MAKAKKEENKKSVTKEEVKTKEVKTKKETKKVIKEEKKAKKQEIIKERKKIEDKIDVLLKDKKATKDKDSKKKIKKEINKLKVERSNIGKKSTFLGNVKKEMKMVRWPKSDEVVKYSIACLIFVLFFALFFFGIDALFALVKDLID